MFQERSRLPTEKIDLRKSIRQDRINIDVLNAVLRVENIDYSVLNCSPFGVAISCDDKFASLNKDSIFEAQFVIDNVTTQQLKLKIVRSEPLYEGKYKVAFEIMDEALDTAVVLASHQTTECLAEIVKKVQLNDEVPNKFRYLTFELKEILTLFKEQLDSLEESFQSSSVPELRNMEEAAVEIVSEFMRIHFDPKIDELTTGLKGVSEECLKISYSFFRSQVSELLNLAPFSNRSLNKPLGYAGDFEMMNMIYRNEPLGKSIFSKSVHKYMVNMSGGKAVRNRAHFLHGKLCSYFKAKDDGYKGKTLSVASGPAMEVQLFLKEINNPINVDPRNIEFHFLDQDLSSLKYAQRALTSLSLESSVAMSLDFFHLDIKRVIMRGLPESNYDVIYSAGLFDYFTDSVARRAAERLLDGLQSGGQLIIGNFDVSSPSKLFMELAWDWNLIYRTREELLQLFGGLGSSICIESEPEKVNLFCVITK